MRCCVIKANNRLCKNHCQLGNDCCYIHDPKYVTVQNQRKTMKNLIVLKYLLILFTFFIVYFSVMFIQEHFQIKLQEESEQCTNFSIFQEYLEIIRQKVVFSVKQVQGSYNIVLQQLRDGLLWDDWDSLCKRFVQC